MNALDIVVIAVILFSGLFAFARGFVKEALSVAAWIGAALAAFYALPYVGPIAAKFLPKGPIADAAAGFAVFLVALLLLSFVTSAVASRVKESSLSAVDRTLGLIFGLIRGGVLVCLAYIAVSWVLPEGKQPLPAWIAEARTRPLLAEGAERLRQLLPAAYRDKAESAVSETRRAAEQMKDAAGAMGALTNPRPPVTPAPDHPAAYDQRGLDRLIQEQQQDRQ
jgi:membrane protein required for colicin V production